MNAISVSHIPFAELPVEARALFFINALAAIDEVEFFNQALSTAEIQSLFSAGISVEACAECRRHD